MAAMADFNLELARKLKTAFDENILSEQEFNDQKAKLLREIWQPRVEAMPEPLEIALTIARKRGRHDAAFIESVTAIFRRINRLWDAQSAEILQVLGEREDLRCETSPRRRHRGRSLRRRRWSSHREPDKLEDKHSSRSRSRDRDHGRRRSFSSPPPAARVEVAPPTPVELDAGHYPIRLQRIRDANVSLNQGDWNTICEELDDSAMRYAVRNRRLDALITQNELLKDDIDN